MNSENTKKLLILCLYLSIIREGINLSYGIIKLIF